MYLAIAAPLSSPLGICRESAIAAVSQPVGVQGHAQHQTAPDASDAAILSSEVHKRQSVSGVGVFTAFEDGRVRVRFNDRTLVSIDRWHCNAEVLQQDGTRVTVSVRLVVDGQCRVVERIQLH